MIQRVPNDKDDASPAFRRHRHAADELDCIAEPLVRADEDGLAFDVFTAEPHRQRKFRIGCRRHLQSRFVFGPADLEIARQQITDEDGTKSIPSSC
jgi:hypothetical protein